MGKDVTIIEGQPCQRGRYSRAAVADADENKRGNQKQKGEQSEDRKTPHIDIQGSDVGRKRVGRALPPPNSPLAHMSFQLKEEVQVCLRGCVLCLFL